jgi:hypothetical protein
MKKLKYLTIPLMFVFIAGLFGRSVIPEMKEMVNAFGSQEKLAPCLANYSEPGVVPDALTLCNMAKPVITKAEKKGNILYYTCEARVEKCPQSPKAVGTVRIFTMGWENEKIVSFEYGGPKSGAVEY